MSASNSYVADDIETEVAAPAALDDTSSKEDATTAKPYWRTGKPIELILCTLVAGAGYAMESNKIPFERPIPYEVIYNNDGEEQVILNQVYNQELVSPTVSTQLVLVLAFLAPFVLQIFLVWCSKHKHNNDPWDSTHKTICLYFLACGLDVILTDFSKLYVGYLRPNFYAYCAPDDDFQECTSEKGNAKGRISFLSAHASASFCGLLLLSLFLDSTFGIQRDNKKSSPPLQRLVTALCYSPVVLAFFISISRVRDNFHHPADVVGGALLGGSIAIFAYGIYFD
jgi:diacylglycerol diphosphate phosphatase/phosphatidate phosphatase